MMNTQTDMIDWGKLSSGNWELYLAKTDKGLCYVGTPGEPFETFANQLAKRFPGSSFRQNEEALTEYIRELEDYLTGGRRHFSLPTDIRGTYFQQEVWEALNTIPYGKTLSYSDIASLINRPTAVRAVGTAIGANPLLITTPCHRVIGKNGAISGYRGGLEFKNFLLQLEAETGLKQ